MHTYVCLLRAVNVSGVNKLPMADFRKMLTELGLVKVSTYIQSGNAVFQGGPGLEATLPGELEARLQEFLGNRIHVFVYTAKDFESLSGWPGPLPEAHAYYVFFESEPTETTARALEKEDFHHEQIIIRGRVGYLHCRKGMGRAKLNNGLIERRLGISSTVRNHRTVQRILELCQDL